MSVSTLSYVVWAAIGVAALALWWWSVIRPGAVAAPGEVVGRLVANPVLRVVLVLGFMWLGWHLFAR
jgi:hypothetical protein